MGLSWTNDPVPGLSRSTQKSDSEESHAAMNSKRLSFQSRTAIVLTVSSLLGLLLLSVISNTNTAAATLFEETASNIVHRQLDDSNEKDYSSYSCGHIYDITPEKNEAQCQFARTCNGGDGVWAPFVFCSPLSTTLLCVLLSPVIVIWLFVLFRMLGSTAEDYFSPALEMFSIKLGLPPRFAGVTLLALGNGAADVSATVSAITSDAQNGYKLSLGALTGATMFIGAVVSATVIIVADGVPCRGALVRDVTALLVTVLIVWRRLDSGIVGPETITLFLSSYVMFVVLVLVADVYHRAVVLPRRAQVAQESERERQFEEQRLQEEAIDQSERDDGTGNFRVSNVMTALSNYDNAPQNGEGWGVESDDLAQDRPVMLHGTHGILTGDGRLSDGNANLDADGYHILDEAVDRLCVEQGSTGVAVGNWKEAFVDNQRELKDHAESVWEDIVWNGDVHIVDKFLLICELPFTAMRKLTISVPCEGYYVRSLIALSMAISPVWFAFYLWRSNGVNVFSFWEYYLGYLVSALVVALLIIRFAPGGEGNMNVVFAVPVALYGFVMAATWIDTIADSLVSLLNFIGIILSIPPPVLGLTLLAWGNSMSDLSANMAMARKGLANMAMTACFAGPVFNILVGLGLGFSTLAAKTGQNKREVALSPSVLTGFLFIGLNTVAIIAGGLFFGKGRIPKVYGFISLGLYTIYVASSITLQYSRYGDN